MIMIRINLTYLHHQLRYIYKQNDDLLQALNHFKNHLLFNQKTKIQWSYEVSQTGLH
jgi:hypothetical protein